MAKAFAESLGVEAEFVEIDWDNKILELGAKTIDCVWNGMTLTDEVTERDVLLERILQQLPGRRRSCRQGSRLPECRQLAAP